VPDGGQPALAGADSRAAMRVAVANLKGGVGKTTTAVYLAAGLHRLGRVLLVDADPQQSALLWKQQDPIFPFTVVSMPVRTLHRDLADLGRGYDHVIIDTPPADTGIIRSAVMAVDVVIVPASPTGLDVNRIMPTIDLLAEVEPIHAVQVGVLLTKVRRGTLSARSVRDVLGEVGLPVLDTEIPLAEMYAGSFGIAPTDLGHYDDLIKELTS
jgi:chromosome partitioning protein